MDITAKHRRVRREKIIPGLRFPDFTESWIEKKYGEVLEFKQTNSLSRDSLNYDIGTVKNIHYGDIHTKFHTNFDILCEEVPFINEVVDISKIKEENYCKNGDLVIADASEDYGDVGKTIEIRNLHNQKVVAGLHTFIARPKNGSFAPGFAGYLMKSWTVRLQVMMLAQGTKVFGISSRHLADVIFKIPHLQEQQKIATFLYTIDQKIQQLTRKKELLEQYKKGISSLLLTGIKRFDDFILSKDRQDSPYGKIPKDWELERIDNATERLWIGLVTTMTANYVDSGVPLVRNSDISINGIDTNGLIHLSQKFAQENSNRAFKRGDVVTVHTGDVGVSAIVSKELEGAIGFATLNTRWNQDLVYNEFVKQFFNFRRFRNLSIRFSTGDGRQNLNLKDFKKFLIPIPSIQEQQKIANYLNLIDNRIEFTEEQIIQTQNFKEGLLQQLFV